MTTLRKDLNLIADLVENNSKVIDVGCGNGELINFLSKNKNAEYWTDVIYRNKSKKFNQTSPEFKRLIKLKNFYQTPHIGGATQDAMKKAEEIVFKEFKKIYSPFSKS